MTKPITFLFFISFLFAGIHRVPQDRETIQEGVNAAEPGDTVLVEEGTELGGSVTLSSVDSTGPDPYQCGHGASTVGPRCCYGRGYPDSGT